MRRPRRTEGFYQLSEWKNSGPQLRLGAVHGGDIGDNGIRKIVVPMSPEVRRGLGPVRGQVSEALGEQWFEDGRAWIKGSHGLLCPKAPVGRR